MDIEVLKAIYEEVKEGKKVALVVLTGNQKSAPGKEGAVMAVKEDGSIVSSVGGGALEKLIIDQAIEAIRTNTDMEFNHNLGDKGKLNMACGGITKGTIKVFHPNLNLIIFGGGHVSQRLARISSLTGFDVTIVDDREEFSKARDFENIKSYVAKLPKDSLDDLSFSKSTTYIVVCTRDHALDKDAVAAVIDKDYAYLGVIGSKRKTGKLRQDVLDAGYDKDLVDNIYMPIGLKIDDGSIEEIAMSILSEILVIKNSKDKIVHNKIKFE